MEAVCCGPSSPGIRSTDRGYTASLENCTDEWRDIKALEYTSYLRAHQCSETDHGRSVDVPDRIKDSVLSKVSDNHGAHLLSEDKPISKQLEGFSIY